MHHILLVSCVLPDCLVFVRGWGNVIASPLSVSRYSILVLSDMVEGFGANLPMVVLPYILETCFCLMGWGRFLKVQNVRRFIDP